jgi:type IV pilus assembly protein PilN
MRLTINLATRRYINLRQLNAALLLGFVLLGSLALYKVMQVAHNAAEITRIGTLSQGTGRREGGTRVSEAQLKARQVQVQFANAIIDRKTVNWLTLLDRLEEVVPAGVAITSIQPGETVNISGVARGFDNLRALLEAMERSPHFSEVYLLSQTNAKVELTQEGLTFNLSCKVALR